MLGVYNALLLPFRLFVSLWGAWPWRDSERRQEWTERRGTSLPSVRAGGLWVHGASVGEARIVNALARGVRSVDPARPLSVSAYTRTGRAQLLEPPDVDAAFFVPLDFPGGTLRVLDALRPALLALVETELWPNLLHQAHRADTPVLVLNGRLSRERMARYRRLKGLYRPLLERLTAVGAQSAEDAERFSFMGVPASAIHVTGNIKYDLPAPADDGSELRGRFDLPSQRPVLVAGSTGAGEESHVLDAFVEARRQLSDLLLVLAPRHPGRADQVEGLVRARGLRVARLSLEPTPSAAGLDVLLVDTVGELARLYRLAWVAFVGGSLVPVGGHNVLEPAALGVPVLYGTHTHHVSAPVAALEAAGGGRRVRDARELARTVVRLVSDGQVRRRMGQQARSVIEANRGAMERSLRLVMTTLDGVGADRSALRSR